MARVERMLRDEQIAHEVETYNQLIPDAGRALGDADDRADLGGRAPGVAAHARRHPRTHRDRAARRQRACRRRRPRTTSCGSPATTSPPAVHFLKFRSRPSRRRDVRERPGAHRRRPPGVRPGRAAHGRSSASELLDRPARPVVASQRRSIRIRRLDPERPAPGAAARGRRGLRPHRARPARGSSRAADGRSCRPASRSRSPTGYAGFVQPRSGPRAAPRRHVPEHARAHRRRVPRRDQRPAREPRSARRVRRASGAIASRSS